MTTQRVIRIFGTARVEAAVGSEHRAQKISVEPNQGAQKCFHWSGFTHGTSFRQPLKTGSQPLDRPGRGCQTIGRAHQQIHSPKTGLRLPKRFADASLNAIAILRERRVFAGNHYAKARGARRAASIEESKPLHAAPRPAMQKGLELRTCADALVPAESLFARYAGPGHTLRAVADMLRQPDARDRVLDAS